MITRSQNYPGYDGWYEPPRCEALVKETTAVVFGWSAAQSKHVRAYTKLYSTDLGKYVLLAWNGRVQKYHCRLFEPEIRIWPDLKF